MAATKFLAPLFLLFVFSTYINKWNNRTDYCWAGVQRNPDFKFSALLREKCVSFGYEVLNRWLRTQQVNDMCYGHSLIWRTILLLGGDIELNPGDGGAHCGMCLRLVKRTESAVQCSECYGLFHSECCRLGNEHELLISLSHTWLCPQCDQSNFSHGFPRSEDDVLYSENQYHLLSSEVSTQNNSQNTSEFPINLNANKGRNQPSQRRSNLSCLLINCRSLKNKVADLASIVEEHKPDVILGNESWLTPDITDAEIFPDDYNVYRKDRADGYGGVFQAFKKDLIVTQRFELDTDCEIVWTQCQLAGKKDKSLLFASYYRPQAHDIKSLHEFDKSLLTLGNKLLRHNVIVAGDFNAPNINWENHQISGNVSSSELLLEIIDKHDLSQFVKEPTRTQLGTQNILDLVLANNRNIVRDVKVIPGISDHEIVSFKLYTRCKKKRNVKRKVFIRKKADSNRIIKELRAFSESFDMQSEGKSLNDKWNNFESVMQNILNNCVPHKITSSRHNLPWFTRSLRRQIRRKQKLYNKAKRSRNRTHWNEFREAKRNVHRNLKIARENYISDFLGDSIRENPKRFWSYIKKLNKDNVGLPDFEINGKCISDRKQKAEILSKQFSGVFTKENTKNIPDIRVNPNPSIDPLEICVWGVIAQLSTLNPNKASGPDDIPAWFMKEYANEIAPTLTKIFQESVDSGVVPTKWKNANVTAIFKKGSKSDPSNYRPISLTSIASKVLEHIVHSHIMKYFDQCNILSDVQHGFRAKRSTVTQLIAAIHDISGAIDNDSNIHAVILDFEKAFDKVPHQRLLKKLQSYGIQGLLYKWLESFLTDRFQTVVCEGEAAYPRPVTSGVPQGTVLGPLLFLVYINDLPDTLHSRIRLFADDALLYGLISGGPDCDELQEDLYKLEIWQESWQMKFNPDKCKMLCISTKKNPLQTKYMFCNSELEYVDSVSYLGVTFDKKLKFSEHVSSISSKASKVLGMARRNFWNCPQNVRETVYTSIIRPKLEYASVAWDPHYKKDIRTIEMVQRKGARFCLQNYSPQASVTDMLSKLGWKSLEQRRMEGRLSMMFKLSHNLVDLDTDQYLIPHPESRTRGSHPLKYQIPKANKDVFKYSYFTRTIKEWNKLPHDIVMSSSLDLFKAKLDRYF